MADVRDGVGPYLTIFLLQKQSWNAQSIGVALSAMGISTLVFQTPAGQFIDKTFHKREATAFASLLMALSCLGMTKFSSYYPILFFQVLCGISAAIIGSSIGAMTLGIVKQEGLARQTGSNESYNHAGNVVAAILAGLLGKYLGVEWIFYLVAMMSLLSIVMTLKIRPEDIDDHAARGCEDDLPQEKINFWKVITQKNIFLFTLTMMIFHFANAAMLPMAGQLLSLSSPDNASLYLSSCIVIAQVVMIPVAWASGNLATTWGRKPLFMTALLTLALRGLLYTFSSNALYIIIVQALDGIGAGIFGVVSVLVIADLTRGTGHFNLVLGAVGTAVGIGASLSNMSAGYIIQHHGFNFAFTTLSILALIGAGLYYFLIPETNSQRMSHEKIQGNNHANQLLASRKN